MPQKRERIGLFTYPDFALPEAVYFDFWDFGNREEHVSKNCIKIKNVI
jgi:hypothetical protein